MTKTTLIIYSNKDVNPERIKSTKTSYFDIPDSNDFVLGNKDFTIDFYMYFSIFSLAGNNFLRKRFLERL